MSNLTFIKCSNIQVVTKSDHALDFIIFSMFHYLLLLSMLIKDNISLYRDENAHQMSTNLNILVNNIIKHNINE